MSAPEPGAAGRTRVERFTRAERVTHWVNAVLWFGAIITATYFKFGWGQSLVTDRQLVRNVHVVLGLAIVAAFLVAVAGRWGAALRADLRRFNRWSRDDRRWLRSFGNDRTVRLGKFNPGQKLNAVFVGATALILAVTGSIMRWNQSFSADLRTGADFVHGWFALFVGLAIAGHIVLAFRDRDALDGMIGGTVAVEWARHHSPRWAAEVTATSAADGPGNPSEAAALDA
jgi:formate dehydrogenase subunit gamma